VCLFGVRILLYFVRYRYQKRHDRIVWTTKQAPHETLISSITITITVAIAIAILVTLTIIIDVT
jgi:heme/copper-type cytochrome/quinol oxidase subunit 2